MTGYTFAANADHKEIMYKTWIKAFLIHAYLITGFLLIPSLSAETDWLLDIQYQKTMEKIVRREIAPYMEKRPKVTMTAEDNSREAFLQNTPSRSGVFISLFNGKTKKLMGCMGSISPARDNFYDELTHWANMAFLMDPRTSRKDRQEISSENIKIVISVILEKEKISSPEVDPIRYGLAVRYRGKEALVLPGEARTSAYAYKMVREKLALPADVPLYAMTFYRLSAIRFGSGKYLMQS